MGAKKKTAKKAATPPPARITKKELEPDNKSATPATETKSAASAKAGERRRYEVTLIPPANTPDPMNARRTLKPHKLSPPDLKTPLDDRDAAIAQATAALHSVIIPGVRAVVMSYPYAAGKGARGREEFTAVIDQGRPKVGR